MKAKQKLREAVDLLYCRGCAGTEAYSRLLLECFRNADADQARRLQSHMKLHSFTPTTSFFHNRLLQIYAKSGYISDAQDLFERMCHRDVFSWNAMLSAYSKLGSIDDLLALFNQMPTRDTVSYNTIIAGLVGHGSCKMAFDFFTRMQGEGFVPTEHTYVSVLNACSQLLDLRLGRQIHGWITARNLRENLYVWNSLIDMYSRCGELDLARWLFDRMVVRNIVLWNSMIHSYLRNGLPKKCIELFHDMRFSGVKPDLVTVSSVLGAILQIGTTEEADKVFRGIEKRDKVCWTIMIAGYAQNGKEEDALKLFTEMLLDDIRPDGFTISSVVSVCSRLASLDRGKVLHGIAIISGLEGDLLISSALVDMYSKCGDTTDAWIVFKLMPSRNVVSWNSMIVGFAQNGLDEEALALYERMLQEKLKPDNITLVGVLSACSHIGLIECGRRYFHSISELHGMKPTLDHYTCMINLLGRSGYMKEAVDMILGMPEEPNSLIWSTVLFVSALNKDIEHGELAARHLFEIDPLNASPYIMLSNMYAACGRWDGVASLRSLMKDRNIRKIAAYSSIEIDNKVYKFVSDDRTHPQTDIIYNKLNELIKKLQQVGFASDTDFVFHDVSEEEKFESICYHSEKLALSFGLISKPSGAIPIRIMKNIRVCGDCHLFMKLVSRSTQRSIVLRDSNRFHHFDNGQCSCRDYW
ncbi:pentatricopeptide repeat-containing protein At2g01510, mitochondrial-like [Macadamia integrifolia]|uniref:pentatricopeptide repeat-containing protein At2g01510, mitochondrial-like n=1 Tax=Macadamia integrifolia TaxID=60698 RepID=UPI001C4FE39F|nr:pentatricopeptide repeat-containing protein At2g01510, mitochondrial-like [Macadamia integrifolia]